MSSRILVVEDDERIRSSMRLALEEEGYDVDDVGSGEEALDLGEVVDVQSGQAMKGRSSRSTACSRSAFPSEERGRACRGCAGRGWRGQRGHPRLCYTVDVCS